MSKKPRYYYDAEAIREKAEYGRRDWSSISGNLASVGGGRGTATVSGSDPLAGRNKRSVWNIATQAYKEAHFATFPEALVNPCILAGTPEPGCCADCGAPRERQVYKTRSFESGSGRSGNPIAGKQPAVHGGGETKDIRRGPTISVQTTGWKPSCDCKAETRPSLVLGPFGGSGTVGLRAKNMGREYTLIELNPEYAKMAERRMSQEVLL